MGYCVNALPHGANDDCLKFPAPLDNIIITDEDVSFTEAELLVYGNWREDIQENLTIHVPARLATYEVTTDDPTINTTGLLRKTFVRAGVPSAVFHLEANMCDWNETLRTLKGGTYRMWFVLADGSIMGYKDRDATSVKGFKCELTAQWPGVPLPDAVESNYRIYANFIDKSEFDQPYVKNLDWSIQAKLPAAVPLGYKMDLVSENQATATVVVNVYERCGDAVTGLATGDVENISDTLTDDTLVSVTDNGDGNYTIVWTTAAAGEYIKFRFKEVTGSVVDAVSNPLYVEFT